MREGLPDNCESESLSVMRKFGMKRGVVNNEQLIKSSRRMVSQERMGIFSHCTLKDILKRRLKHLLICLEWINGGPSQPVPSVVCLNGLFDRGSVLSVII